MIIPWINSLTWIFMLFEIGHPSMVETANGLVPGVVAVHKVSRHSGDALTVARAAITVLRNLAAESEATVASGVRLRPDSRILTDAEAATLLASLPKPLQCRAGITGEALEIDCGPVAEENRWILFAKEYMLQNNPDPPVDHDQLILFTGIAGSIVVTGADAARFDSEYVLLGTYDVIHNPPPRVTSDGVVAVRHYRKSHSGMGHD